MQPFYFTIANEDYNCYTFDMRIIEKGPILMHAGHVNAVMDIDYSPSGLEFCTASYDTTIRIFRVDSADYTSREVYHTQRMNKVFCCKFTDDARFILSGSDDHGIRIWKANASEPLRHMSKEEKGKIQYNEKLIERYKNLPAIRSIYKYRHLPEKLYNQIKQQNIKRKAEERRQERVERYSTKNKEFKVKGIPKKPDAMRRNFIFKSVE